jgi:hypothetical protein
MARGAALKNHAGVNRMVDSFCPEKSADSILLVARNGSNLDKLPRNEGSLVAKVGIEHAGDVLSISIKHSRPSEFSDGCSYKRTKNLGPLGDFKGVKLALINPGSAIAGVAAID